MKHGYFGNVNFNRKLRFKSPDTRTKPFYIRYAVIFHLGGKQNRLHLDMRRYLHRRRIQRYFFNTRRCKAKISYRSAITSSQIVAGDKFVKILRNRLPSDNRKVGGCKS